MTELRTTEKKRKKHTIRKVITVLAVLTLVAVGVLVFLYYSTKGAQTVIGTVMHVTEEPIDVLSKTEAVWDREPPVIEGVEELTIEAGASVSYKRGVTVTDNYDENAELTVDNSEVDLYEPGDYPIVYIATDKYGNEARVESVIHVKQASIENVTEELVNELADRLLAELLTDDMTEYEKAEAIFWWVHDIVYTKGTPKTDWVEGAYRGLTEYRGDCFVYAMTAKCLLTRAGIENMDIVKIPTTTRHYWNLINLGEGWYHYDCCNGRMEGKYFFYATDEKMMEYSRTHNGSNNYDPSLYPEIE